MASAQFKSRSDYKFDAKSLEISVRLTPTIPALTSSAAPKSYCICSAPLITTFQIDSATVRCKLSYHLTVERVNHIINSESHNCLYLRTYCCSSYTITVYRFDMCSSLQPWVMLDVKLFAIVLSLVIICLLIAHFGARLLGHLKKEGSQWLNEYIELARRMRTLFITKERMVQAYDKVRHPQ
jgi:hypothetical protein